MGIRTLPLLVDFPAVFLHYRVESHHLISLHSRTKIIARGFIPKFCALPESLEEGKNGGKKRRLPDLASHQGLTPELASDLVEFSPQPQPIQAKDSSKKKAGWKE